LTFVSLPSVLIDVVNFTGFDLNFFYIIVATKGVDCGGLNAHSWEETYFAWHRCAVVYVFVDVLETVIAHTSKKEPRSDILVLLLGYGGLSLGAPVHEDRCKVARELSLVLRNQAPLRVLFCLGTLQVQPTNFTSTKLKPEHVVCQIQVQVVLLRIGLKQF